MEQWFIPAKRNIWDSSSYQVLIENIWECSSYQVLIENIWNSGSFQHRETYRTVLHTRFLIENTWNSSSYLVFHREHMEQ